MSAYLSAELDEVVEHAEAPLAVLVRAALAEQRAELRHELVEVRDQLVLECLKLGELINDKCGRRCEASGN